MAKIADKKSLMDTNIFATAKFEFFTFPQKKAGQNMVLLTKQRSYKVRITNKE
jgi:hypothetical protein